MRRDTGIASDDRQRTGVTIGSLRNKLCVLAVMAASAVALPTGAQNSLAPGCGPADEKFSVTTDKNYHPEATPDNGKAAVYLIQDDRDFAAVPKPVVRMGMDGKWAGATHGSSYLFAVVEPGEHHLCAIRQGEPLLAAKYKTGALHFTAEAGKKYFFVVRDRFHLHEGELPMQFETLDSDQGKLLISQFAHAVSQPKK
jgi:hypothetical protein